MDKCKLLELLEERGESTLSQRENANYGALFAPSPLTFFPIFSPNFPNNFPLNNLSSLFPHYLPYYLLNKLPHFYTNIFNFISIVEYTFEFHFKCR